MISVMEANPGNFETDAAAKAALVETGPQCQERHGSHFDPAALTAAMHDGG